MQKIRTKIKNKIYPVLWITIILCSIYIILRFVAISFSEDMGQASLRNAMTYKFCNVMIETGSHLISYAADNKDSGYGFPVNLVDRELPVKKFIDDSSLMIANLQNPETYELQNSGMKDLENQGLNEFENQGLNDLDIYEIDGSLGLEYLITNGAVLQSLTTGILLGDEKLIDGQLQIGYLEGNISQNDIRDDIAAGDEIVEAVTTGETVDFTMEQLSEISFLITNFYSVDASTTVTETLFDADELLNKDMTIKQSSDAPQILIYHTHSQEAYSDSEPGVEEDTVVGVGEYLAKILSENYGYNVIHDTTPYDILDTEKKSRVAYTEALEGLTKDLEENPTIEVMIDLHRNSGAAKTIMLDGKETAQIMMFNGLCRDHNGPLTNLDNPYLQDNLAFSFQLQLKSKEIYPRLFLKNYLKNYRFNMHLRPKSMLVELGTVNNTVESAMNAMIPFAKILDDVLQGE